MKQHNMEYQTAHDLVKSKRRFVQPNIGFVAQLKLWKRMGCTIDPQYQKYKIYRLRLAGEQVRKGVCFFLISQLARTYTYVYIFGILW